MTATTYEGYSLSEMRNRIEASIAEHRGWYVFQGIVFILAGALAIFLPNATALGFNILIGALLIVSGLVQGFASLRSGMHWWSLISALASLIIGGLMLFYPMTGMIALATVLAVFLTIEGVTELMLAFQFKPARNWGWMLFSGIISLLLAVLLFAGWPGVTVMFLGIIIGVNLLLYGISLLALTASVQRE